MSNIIDFNKQPGARLNVLNFEKEYDPLISIIIPFYNDKNYIRQSICSVLNQTFPCFEILIIDDGSKNEESLKELEAVSKLDKRIKVFHKSNEGLAATRDYGAKKADDKSKYLFFLDSDDLIEKTYLECAYWTLETNKDAAWAYTDTVGFEADEYTWNKWFDSKKLRKENELVATALIRKEDFWKVNGYELREKAVNEDWNFWLKMIALEKFPVRMNFYGFWYRRKHSNSELSKANENKKRTLEIIKETSKKIKKEVKAIQYPKYDYNWENIDNNIEYICPVKKAKKKIRLLVIIPWMIVGGADKFNIDLLNGLNKNEYEITIITTEPAINVYKHQYDEAINIYDLTTFLDQKYWLDFIHYIIKKENINIILNTNSVIGYSILPYLKANYPQIPIIDYIHMEEWYNRNGGYSRDSSGVSSVIDKTLTCNKNSMKILEKHFKREPNELETVYIGVNENEFNPEDYDNEKLRNEFGISKKYVIGYICRIAYQKRPFLLLEIIKKLKEKRNDFEFVIAGDGELLPAIKAKAKDMKLNENIKFLGNVSETQKIYAISDLTLNCSIKEGLALTSYESLSMGVPVISSDVGGQKELINEEVGIIVPCIQKEEDILEAKYSEDEINQYVDGIEKIINNLEKYKVKCRQRILNGFTIKQMISNMGTIIENIANNPNKGKTKNGESLKNNLDITRELVARSFEQFKETYKWECISYKKFYGFETEKNYKFELFKEKMWQHSAYRFIIRTLQKFGIIRIIKNKMRG